MKRSGLRALLVLPALPAEGRPVAERFSLEATAASYLALYRATLAQARAA